jgi:hypothetical protein
MSEFWLKRPTRTQIIISPPEPQSKRDVLMELILLVLGAMLFLFLWMASIKREKELFNKRFPPLSDAEFVERCSAGVNPQRALKVRRIVAEHLCVDYDRVHPSTRFVEDLGAD